VRPRRMRWAPFPSELFSKERLIITPCMGADLCDGGGCDGLCARLRVPLSLSVCVCVCVCVLRGLLRISFGGLTCATEADAIGSVPL